MIRKLSDNTLLLQALGLYACYAALGFVVPKPLMSSAVGILALMAGIMMAVRYGWMAWNILIHKERGEYGGHYAVLGAFEISIGIIYSGAFRIVWNWFGSQPSWTGTAFSSLGLFLIAHGVYLQARSPDAVAVDARFPPGFWNIAIWVMCMIVAFVAGTQINGAAP